MTTPEEIQKIASQVACNRRRKMFYLPGWTKVKLPKGEEATTNTSLAAMDGTEGDFFVGKYMAAFELSSDALMYRLRYKGKVVA